MGPEVLGPIIASLHPLRDDRVIVGFDTADDAGVVRLDADTALVQTVDFFTPIVDDPYTWGAIAVANALSDVYAMGGRPLCALNIVAWPKGLDPALLAEVLRGGADKLAEAGVLLVGGHSVRDEEPKYGLAVTGLVHPDRVWTNAGARPGDVLVLTKALGIGIVTTAAMRDRCPAGALEAAVAAMLLLNGAAADAARAHAVHACTDVTGYGLLGHAWEMAVASGVAVEIEAASIPALPHALRLADAGMVTGNAKGNIQMVGARLSWKGVPHPLRALLADPQTSGGLLFACPPEAADALVEAGVGTAIGRVKRGPPRFDVRYSSDASPATIG